MIVKLYYYYYLLLLVIFRCLLLLIRKLLRQRLSLCAIKHLTVLCAELRKFEVIHDRSQLGTVVLLAPLTPYLQVTSQVSCMMLMLLK
jgi:hypothetical protein